MESAFAWIGNIASWFGEWIPRWQVIQTTHGGVKMRSFRIRDVVRGRKVGMEVVALGPGFHLYWPLSTEMVLYPTARQAADLRTQTLMTTDGKTIVVGGLIVYEINDIKNILAYTYDPDQTVKDIAISAIHDVMVRMSWIDIRTGMEFGTLNLKLRKRVKSELAKYGVKVLKVALTDLAQTRVYKIIQSTAQDGI